MSKRAALGPAAVPCAVPVVAVIGFTQPEVFMAVLNNVSRARARALRSGKWWGGL